MNMKGLWLGLAVGTTFICLFGQGVFSAASKETDSPKGISPEIVAEYVHSVVQADRTFYQTEVVDRMQEKGMVSANYGRLFREGFSGFNPIGVLEAMAKQRSAEARGVEVHVDDLLPPSVEEGRKRGITGIDVLEATDYYRTSRGQKPHGLNRSLLSHQAAKS